MSIHPEFIKDNIYAIIRDLGRDNALNLVVSSDNPDLMKECVHNEYFDSDAKKDLIQAVKSPEYIKSCMEDENLIEILSSDAKAQLISLVNETEYIKQCVKSKDLRLRALEKMKLIHKLNDAEYTKECIEGSNGVQLDGLSRLKLILGLKSKKYIEEYIDKTLEMPDRYLENAVLKFATGDDKYFVEENQQMKSLMIPEDLHYGIEIESGGSREFGKWAQSSIKSLNSWKFVSDGAGVELASPILSNDEKSITNIYRTCNFLRQVGQKSTEDDGGHIHFGANYLKNQEAYINLLELYSNTEKILYTISNEKGQKPREGIGEHAMPLSQRVAERYQETQIENTESIEFLKGETHEEFIKKIKSIQKGNRTVGINFNNLDDGSGKEINTIEFRLANGTVNPDTWIENINLFGGLIRASQELSEIQGKDVSELTPEDVRKLHAFDVIKRPNVDEKTKLQMLLELTIPEEERDTYQERYEVNSVLINEDEMMKSGFEQTTAQKPVVLDDWRITARQIGKYCYTRNNPENEPVNGEAMQKTMDRFGRDLAKSREQELENNDVSINK